MGDLSVKRAIELVNSAFSRNGIDIGIENRILNGRTSNNYEVDTPSPLKGNLQEFTGTYSGQNEENKTISLKLDSGNCVGVMPISNTVFSDSKKKGVGLGDVLYIIAVQAGDIYVAATIIDQKEKALFSQVKSLYGRANAIFSFYGYLSGYPKKQERIKRQSLGRRYERIDNETDAYLTSVPDYELAYAMMKENLLPSAQRVVEELLPQRHNSKIKAAERLSIILNISETAGDRREVNRDELIKELDANIYGLKKVKEQVADILVSNQSAKERGANLLFIGPPGTGKTHFAEVLARYCNLKHEILPCSALTVIELCGTSYCYDNAQNGGITSFFYSAGTSESMLVLDELDKVPKTNIEGNPYNPLLHALEGRLEERFLGCEISTRNTFFVATANSIEHMPEALLNRFDKIYFDEYTDEDRFVIAKDFILPKLRDKFSEANKEVCFSDEAIWHIIWNYCADDGARELKRCTESVYRAALCKDYHLIEVGASLVEDVLGEYVSETPAIFFRKHQKEYSVKVREAIKECISFLNDRGNDTIQTDFLYPDKMQTKLDILLSCRIPSVKGSFNASVFMEDVKKNLYGMEPVAKEIARIFTLAISRGERFPNICLVGGYGVGKTQIVKKIAESINREMVKISLSSMRNTGDLCGEGFTYTASQPGCIMKGIKSCGSLLPVFLLDEMDKCNPEVSNSLIDMLDGDFTDHFLNVPVSLEGACFIATANCWEEIPFVIRNRFIPIDVKGYSRDDKGKIVTGYILPKLQEDLKNNITITIRPDANEYLLKTYCKSFGVRDVEGALQRIVGDMLLQAETSGRRKKRLVICIGDVKNSLGEEPIARGNFPDVPTPGVAKALAVSNKIEGTTFAVETVLMSGSGKVEITGLAKNSALESVRVAIANVKRLFPGLLTEKDIFIHFGEGAIEKDGPSAGIAIFSSIISAAFSKPVFSEKANDIAFTGEISLTGGVFAVGGVHEKVQAACDSGCKKVFIPMQNYRQLKDELKKYPCEIIPLSRVEQILETFSIEDTMNQLSGIFSA